MSFFRCNYCQQTYQDHYPSDDCCILCKKGTVKIVENKMVSVKPFNHFIYGT